MKTRYYMKYSVQYHFFHTTFYVLSRKINYFWDSPRLPPPRLHGMQGVRHRVLEHTADSDSAVSNIPGKVYYLHEIEIICKKLYWVNNHVVRYF